MTATSSSEPTERADAESRPDADSRPDNSARGAAAAAICKVTPTQCLTRTRLYRNGTLVLEGFPVSDISDYLEDPAATIWLDLLKPKQSDLAVISDEFGLHPLAVEDALQEHERAKLDRYRTHLFLSAYSVRLDVDSGELITAEVAAFITEQALITVRKHDAPDVDALVQRWDGSPELRTHGVGYLTQGLLDYLVDGHFAAVQSLDDALDVLEDQLFADKPADREVQRRSFELRKSLVLLRRVVLPMREVVNSLMRRDLHVVDETLLPYYQDVYDHVLRATEWTESLRDLVTTILETNLTIQGNRMNIISKKVTSWAAIIAVPTLITGYCGMNIPYPGFAKHWAVFFFTGLMIVASVALYFSFKRRDWL